MSAERIAIYPGSFDPITRGHEDIARRALLFADRVLVAVAFHRTQPKPGLFGIEERLELIRRVFEDEPRIEATSFDGLLVHFARESRARIMIRGLRAITDFEYEFQLALMNRKLWNELETIFLAPDERYTYLSASLVRQIASLGGDVSDFVSAPVLSALQARLTRTKEQT